MLIEEKYELFSGASPLSEPFIIEPNTEEFEELPSKYFENDEIRWVITQMVKNRVPSIDKSTEKFKQSKRDGLIIRKSDYFSKAMEKIWELIVKLNLPLKIRETTRREKAGFKYNGSELILEIFIELDEYSSSVKYKDSTKLGFSYILDETGSIFAGSRPSIGMNMTNIQLNFEEFYHLFQFLNGELWFEKSSVWKPVSDIYDEVEAKKRACQQYPCGELWIGSRLKSNPNIFRFIPSISRCYGIHFSDEEIRLQLVSGITTKVTIWDVNDKGEASWGKVDVSYPQGGYTDSPKSSVPASVKNVVRDSFLFQYPLNSHPILF
jgi:hypothetical protein